MSFGVRARLNTRRMSKRVFVVGVTPWGGRRKHPSSLSLFTGKISRPQKRGGNLCELGKQGIMSGPCVVTGARGKGRRVEGEGGEAAPGES